MRAVCDHSINVGGRVKWKVHYQALSRMGVHPHLSQHGLDVSRHEFKVQEALPCHHVCMEFMAAFPSRILLVLAAGGIRLRTGEARVPLLHEARLLLG
jgi:hypothetical protein